MHAADRIQRHFGAVPNVPCFLDGAPMPRKIATLHSAQARSRAVRHLRQLDTPLAAVIDAVGPFRLELEDDPFRMLFRSILWQQISFAAANTIARRIEERIGPEGVTADALARLSVDELRACGVSRPKAGYLLSLAGQVVSGELDLSELAQLSDTEVHTRLVALRGVGEWTAQMLLIFSLGRTDIFPHGDLGIRVALKRLYGLSELPGREQCLELASPWRPYASVASWYLWKSGD